jgi:hypothetical protein
MRQYRSSGSVEGVMGNHDSYSDCSSPLAEGQGCLLSFTQQQFLGRKASTQT